MQPLSIVDPCFVLKTQNSLTKKRIIKLWSSLKKKTDEQIFRLKIDDDFKFKPLCNSIYELIKPYWIQAFQEDFPNDLPTKEKLYQWLINSGLAYHQLNKKRDSLIWLHMIHFFETIDEFGILPPNKHDVIKK